MTIPCVLDTQINAQADCRRIRPQNKAPLTEAAVEADCRRIQSHNKALLIEAVGAAAGDGR
jgi:hypothetical protein